MNPPPGAYVNHFDPPSPWPHCVPKDYRPKPGEAYSPARVKRTKTTSLTSVATTELACGPNDDGCCDSFSAPIQRAKGGGWQMGACIQAGCAESPVFNMNPPPGAYVNHFDPPSPWPHCVPKDYRPKPGEAYSPARVKRTKTTSLTSVATTELACGPDDDGCCDSFSAPIQPAKGGG